jgi:hypothetical protein
MGANLEEGRVLITTRPSSSFSFNSIQMDPDENSIKLQFIAQNIMSLSEYLIYF